MATTNAVQMTKLLTVPVDLPDPGDVGGRVRVFNERINLAAQASGDIIRVGKLPKGARFLYGVLYTDTTLATATIKIGSTSSDAKYRAAAVFTATNTPTLFGVAADAGEELTAAETVIMTVGTASLPASGILRSILFYTLD